MEEDAEDSQWDQLNRTEWRGLGLTDPIKSIEVRPSAMPICSWLTLRKNTGQMATLACFSQGERLGQAAY